jgi:GH25 family lysozyme M1 (1,4-beta-N-acetylmuramidase)
MPQAFLPPLTADAVIDISHYQKTADFALARQSGIAAAILKASEGAVAVDPAFAGRAAEAAAAGLLIGAYHFLDGSDPVAQAGHFLATVGAALPQALLALDLERNPGGASATADAAASAADHIRARTGRWPLVYAGRWSLRAPHPVLAQCPLWLPEYGAAPVCPPGWDEWRLWQYTDGRTGAAPVPGIGRCDRSRFAGARADLATWWQGAAAILNLQGVV